MVLACDVGSTKTRLSLFDAVGGDALTLVRTETYASRDHASPSTIVTTFAGAQPTPLLESVPVHVILNDEAALLGSAHFALRTARA